MTISIQLPDTLEENLRRAALQQRLSPEVLAVRILEDALSEEMFATPEQVVAQIKALPKNSANIRPASGSLYEALENAPEDPLFDLQEWQAQWALVEEKMKAITRANTLTEGLDI